MSLKHKRHARKKLARAARMAKLSKPRQLTTEGTYVSIKMKAVAEAIVPFLQIQGAISIADIVRVVAGSAIEDLPEAMREAATTFFESELDLSQVNRALRDVFPMATLVRSKFFEEYHHVKPVNPEDTKALVAIGGRSCRAAGIVTSDAMLFDASRRAGASKAGGLVKSVVGDVVRAKEPVPLTAHAVGELVTATGEEAFVSISEASLPLALPEAGKL